MGNDCHQPVDTETKANSSTTQQKKLQKKIKKSNGNNISQEGQNVTTGKTKTNEDHSHTSKSSETKCKEGAPGASYGYCLGAPAAPGASGNSSGGGNHEGSLEYARTTKTNVKQKMYEAINAECKHIKNLCVNNKHLEKLQLKLASYEIMTFNKFKYSRTCAHAKCDNKAPKKFPKSDIYLCSTHLLHMAEKFNNLMSKNHIFEIAGKVNKNGTELEKKTINELIEALQNVKSSFNGSLNIKSRQPEDYWSLIMTKLLITVKYEKHKKNKVVEKLVSDVIQTLILYRYVMNPTGLEILALIVAIVKAVTLVIVAIPPLIKALDAMIFALRSSILFGYATGFVTCMVRRINRTEAVVAGTALVSTGAVGIGAGTGVILHSVAGGASGGSAFGPGGAIIGAGVGVLTGGIVMLVKKYRTQPERAMNRIIVQQEQDIQRLNEMSMGQLNLFYQQLRQQQNNDSDSDADSDTDSKSDDDDIVRMMKMGLEGVNGMAVGNEISPHGQNEIEEIANGMAVANEIDEGSNVYAIRTFFETELNLPEYVQFVMDNGFETIEDLFDVTSDEWKEIGVTKLCHRKKILKTLKEKKQFLNKSNN